MNRVKTINWLGIVERHSNGLELIKKSGDCVLVQRGYPRNFIIMCPDGCEEVITTNLDPASGPAWNFYEKNGLRTLYPSIVLAAGCQSHFILWRDKILWCQGDRYHGNIAIDKSLLLAVKSCLQLKPLHFTELALQIGELPWEVLWACKELVKMGHAKEIRIGYFTLNQTCTRK